MLRSILVGVLLLTIAAIVLPWPAGAETRIALVIGNSAYQAGPLGSPKDDAKAMEDKLKTLGFQVTRKIDMNRGELFNVIRDFADHLKQPGTVGLFYYSGHGMQVNNRNYMIPIDADIRSEVDVGQYAVPVDEVLARIELGKSNPNFVILDACRNNPFKKRFKSSQDGLAPMEAPASTLIAFAAAPGQVAEAGSSGKLSLYTAALAEHIDQPYPNFISMFQAVQNAVYERSGHKQSPRFELSPGLLDFSFKPMVTAISSPAFVPYTSRTIAPVVTPAPALMTEQSKWTETVRIDTADAHLSYLEVHPQGVHAAEAQSKLGWMYATGRGVPKNEAQAVQWFRKAADQGNAEAQFNLGRMYEQGRGGLPQDDTQAVQWFRKAADQGNGAAKTNLGAMYEDGRGELPQDDTQAVQ